MKNRRVGVLLGGMSTERSVSLKTGHAIHKALESRGYDAVEIDVGPDLSERLKAEGIEVAFIALHGVHGEDGCVQGMLELLGIPYTGSGVRASAVAMDKRLSKEVMISRGIPTPRWKEVLSSDLARDDFSLSFDFPLVVKPNTQGSTVGIHIVPEARQLSEALNASAQFDEVLVVEEFIPGIEVTVGVINGKVLPVVEIVPPEGFFDFEAKYTVGQSQYFVPARISAELTEECQKWGLKTYEAMGCEGVTRTDIRIHPDGRCFVLEINTVPGMTETSLIPKAGKQIGKSFEDICEDILSTARLKVSRKALSDRL